MLAVYVSGHGFGHATRTAEVLRAVRARAADLPIVVCTSAPAFLFEGVIAPPLAVRRVECDVGLVQKDALVIDEAGTVAAWRAFMDGWDDRVAAEAAWLRRGGRAARPRRHPAAGLRRGGRGRGCVRRPRQLLVGLDLRPPRRRASRPSLEAAARAREAYARAEPAAAAALRGRPVRLPPRRGRAARGPQARRGEGRGAAAAGSRRPPGRPAVVRRARPAGSAAGRLRRADRVPGPAHGPSRLDGSAPSNVRRLDGRGARRRPGSTTRTSSAPSTWS